MFKFLVCSFSVILISSCTFHRARLNKLNSSANKELVSDTINIKDAFGLNHSDLKSKTGIYSLENGGESLIARLWFFDHAQKTLDIQYYSFSKDLTGLMACEKILKAADRGVKVRILIDDAAARMNTYEVKLLDSHDNIDVKVYNAGLRLGRLDRRLVHLSKNYRKVLKRMHNKTLTVDGYVTIIGGRNIADRYYDYSKKYNFRDRDIVMIGKAAKDVSASFQEFWNNDQSVLYTDLSRFLYKKRFKDPKRFDDIHKYAAQTDKFSETMRKRVRDYAGEFKTLNKAGEFFWLENVSFVSDKPDKIKDNKSEQHGLCKDTLQALVKNARKTILIHSPYIIAEQKDLDLLSETVKRGVEVRLLTNSLGSTDNFEAFSGYKRDRKEIIKTGVLLREFRPDAKIRYELMIPEVQSPTNYKAVYGFHPKTLLLDDYVSVVGSYNFDPRSADLNTECIAVIRSEAFYKSLAEQMNKEMLPENSWEITETCNPDKKASLRKRLKVWSRRIVPKKVL
jgi:phosphatidylserine/phosphatidylglycerophosphate/cardiolipin synthase-like enzyme